MFCAFKLMILIFVDTKNNFIAIRWQWIFFFDKFDFILRSLIKMSLIDELMIFTNGKKKKMKWNLRNFKILSYSNFKKKLIFNSFLLRRKNAEKILKRLLLRFWKTFSSKVILLLRIFKEGIYNLLGTRGYIIATLKSYILLQHIQYEVNFLFFKIDESKQNFLNPIKLNIERKNYF